MAVSGNQIATFGDVRRTILDTITDLRSGEMEVGKATAIFMGVKVLNDNVQTEINAAKMALATKDEAHSFGRIVGMGQRLISGDSAK